MEEDMGFKVTHDIIQTNPGLDALVFLEKNLYIVT